MNPALELRALRGATTADANSGEAIAEELEPCDVCGGPGPLDDGGYCTFCAAIEDSCWTCGCEISRGAEYCDKHLDDDDTLSPEYGAFLVDRLGDAALC